ncbi:MAG: polysaccharide biosynthesis tyrosine autokinase [Actinobacteria bacterium]|nr:polysaccharide biosynthesis tyrosine autokinase [Actinomycetota bacterium]
MDETQPYTGDVLDLRDYLTVLKRRKWTVLVTVVLVVAAAMAFTLRQDPLYTARAELVVEPFTGGGDVSALEEALLGRGAIETQREILHSVPVAELVKENIGSDEDVESLLDKVDATVVGETNVMQVRATNGTPETAAALAQGFAEGYLQWRRDDAIERASAAIEELQARTQELRQRLDEIDLQLARLPAESPEGDALRQERTTLLAQAGQLSAQLATSQATEQVLRGGGQIIRPATVPAAPSSPKPLRTGILALVLGTMLGLGLAFLRDHLDDAIRDDDDASQSAGGAPILGHIAHWDDLKGTHRLPSKTEPQGRSAEAFRTLRSNVRFMTAARGHHTLLITSAGASAGKTTISANLATVAASAGNRVLLIDADLRHPDVHNVFAMRRGNDGLSTVLMGDLDLDDVVQPVPGVENLELVTTGRIPPNPAELLGSPSMAKVLTEARDRADLVIVDAPPILAVADPLELAPVCDATFLVVNIGETGRGEIRLATQRLAGVGTPPDGLILNNIAPGDTYYGYYYSAYPYGADREVADDVPVNVDQRPRRSDRSRKRDARSEKATGSWTKDVAPPSDGARTRLPDPSDPLEVDQEGLERLIADAQSRLHAIIHPEEATDAASQPPPVPEVGSEPGVSALPEVSAEVGVGAEAEWGAEHDVGFEPAVPDPDRGEPPVVEPAFHADSETGSEDPTSEFEAEPAVDEAVEEPSAAAASDPDRPAIEEEPSELPEEEPAPSLADEPEADAPTPSPATDAPTRPPAAAAPPEPPEEQDIPRVPSDFLIDDDGLFAHHPARSGDDDPPRRRR